MKTIRLNGVTMNVPEKGDEGFEDAADAILKTLTAPKQAKITKVKVSEKGAISFYGLRAKWPLTMYAQELELILDRADELRKFMADNKASLSFKS